MPNLFKRFKIKSRLSQSTQRTKSCCLATLLLLLLICLLLFGLSYYWAESANAQGPADTQQVLLLIDNSQSMYDKGGVGSDPDLLRIEAARLFMTYLGVDSRGPAHELGVIFFGTDAEAVVPLTPLTDTARRQTMVDLIANPISMSWTNPHKALNLAHRMFRQARTTAAQRTVVLLTDGKPEWANDPTATEQDAITANLRQNAAALADDDIALFIILLQNEATDADPEIESHYIPLWQDMVEQPPRGQFFQVRHSHELLDVYHNIVVSVTNRRTDGVILQTAVET
ncbi:MAG: vWA domain-containing protein, partial [Chloroflexota bacterium]